MVLWYLVYFFLGLIFLEFLDGEVDFVNVMYVFGSCVYVVLLGEEVMVEVRVVYVEVKDLE